MYTGIDARYCDAESGSIKNGISYSWPRTLGGETASVTCPVNSSVLVMRNCSSEGLWQTFTDDGCETVNEQLDGLSSSFTNVRRVLIWGWGGRTMCCMNINSMPITTVIMKPR